MNTIHTIVTVFATFTAVMASPGDGSSPFDEAVSSLSGKVRKDIQAIGEQVQEDFQDIAGQVEEDMQIVAKTDVPVSVDTIGEHIAEEIQNIAGHVQAGIESVGAHIQQSFQQIAQGQVADTVTAQVPSIKPTESTIPDISP